MGQGPGGRQGQSQQTGKEKQQWTWTALRSSPKDAIIIATCFIVDWCKQIPLPVETFSQILESLIKRNYVLNDWI